MGAGIFPHSSRVTFLILGVVCTVMSGGDLPADGMVQRMSRAIGPEMTVQIAAEQREVADAIQDFVSDTFVPRPQFIFDRTVRPEDQQIPRRDARPVSLRFECRGFGLKNEGPRE